MHGHALFLPARHFYRGQRQHDIFDDGQVGYQMKALEYEAQIFTAEIGLLLCVQAIYIDIIYKIAAIAGCVHSTHD